MRRERAGGGTRRGARPRRRMLWIGVLFLLVVGGAGLLLLSGPGGPPPTRPPGAGLPPAPLARSGPSAAPDLESTATARRAEIAAEEARLAALRAARAQLEREIADLRQQVDDRRRDLAGRRTADPVAAGPPAPAAPAVGGGSAAPSQAALPAETQSGRGPRIVIHHRANSAPGAAAAEEVAQTLRGAGFDPATIRGVQFVPSTPVVRYFHDEDQAAAARLAGRLGRGWAIQDFRAYQPQPPPQTLEIWVPGN